MALDWRKHASPLPRMLFRYDQLEIDLRPPDKDGDDASPSPVVQFRTTAADAVLNLEAAGFGWAATVATYAEMRQGSGYSAGAHHAHVMFELQGRQGRSKRNDYVLAAESAQREFDDLSPGTDLDCLGELIAESWRQREEDLFFVGSLSYDGDLPDPVDVASAAWERGLSAGVAHPFAAGRAAETLSMLDRSAPLLLWPMVLCVFLRHLAPDAEVVLDLSEHADVELQFDEHLDLQEYAERYWKDANEFLASEARLMGRLWSVLAGFDNELGREFWINRAGAILHRIRVPDDAVAGSQKAKGDQLESLMEALLRSEEPDLEVIEKNLRTPTAEIDLVATNNLSDPFWIAQSSPLLLIECKNWSKRVGVEELRVFETKMQDRKALCRIGIFVSVGGFTRPFVERLANFHTDGGLIFAIDGADLETMLYERVRLTTWLRKHGLRRSLGHTKPTTQGRAQ